MLVAEINEVEPVAGHGAGRMPCSFESESWNKRDGFEEQRLLNDAGFVGFALHAFAFEAFDFEQACVFDRDRDVSCQSFE